MRKKWLLLALAIGGWLARPQAVEAAYDPAQGGVFWEPPERMWLASGTAGFIPFAYHPPGEMRIGPIKASKLTATFHDSQGSVRTLSEDANQLGVRVSAMKPGVYTIHLTLQPNAGMPFNRTVTLTVAAQAGPRTLVPLPTRRLLSPLPLVLTTTGTQGVGFGELTDKAEETLNGFGWYTGSRAVYIPPVTNINNGVEIVARTRYNAVQLNDQAVPVALTYGLAPVTVTAGQPLTLDALYLKPLPDTTLTFTWSYQAGGNGKAQTVTTTTPWLDVPATWHADGSLTVMLTYSFGGHSVTVKTAATAYHYQAATVRSSAPPVAAKTLLTRDVRLNAGLADWPVAAFDDWRLEVAVSPVQTPTGDRLAATLRLADGTQIASGQVGRLAFRGVQVLPLAQAEWLLQQQPTISAGEYTGTVRFTAISGPE